MLREFINRQNYPRSTDFNEHVGLMVNAFDGCVDFLRDPQRFPNNEINAVATLMWRLIANKEIPVVLDQWGLPSLTFTVTCKGIEQTPMLIIPQDFIQQIEEDPAFQLGIIAYMASQCRDFHCGKIKGNNSVEVNIRAQAFEAETLLILKEMAEKEGVDLTLNPLQLEYLKQFPIGLQSLPSEMAYSTPTYRPPPRDATSN